MTAIIIDDENKSRLSLRQKLRDYCPQVEVVAEAADGFEGINQIDNHHPEIVFLDIRMPRLNGFDMLQRLQSKKFHLIFTTAYDQYAIKAIRFSAFDYLLKPVDIEELKEAISRIDTMQMEKDEQDKKLEVLQANLSAPDKMLNRMAIPTLQGLLFFNIDSIIYLEASSNYTHIYFTDQPRLVASKTLKEFEEMLPSSSFFRIHHSHLINLNFIKKYVKGDGGQVVMNNGDVLDVAKRKKGEFLKVVERYV